MNDGNLFFFIVAVVVFVTRVALYLRPTPSPSLGTFRLHHWMYGSVLMIFGLVIRNIYFFAVGFALFIDELPFLLIGGKTHKDNYSTPSLVGVVVLVVIVFILRHQVVNFLV